MAGKPRKGKHVSVSGAAYAKLKAYATANNVQISQVVVALISDLPKHPEDK